VINHSIVGFGALRCATTHPTRISEIKYESYISFKYSTF